MVSRLWEDVSVGEEIPSQRFPVSWRTLMTQLLATRDFMPYHYHPTYAMSLGMRGAFVNNPFYLCLFGRYVTDWLGPDSDFRSATLQMFDQTVPGDVLEFAGEVTKRWEDGADCLIEVALEFRHALGVAAISTMVIVMPSRERGPAKLRALPPLPEIEISSEIPEAARVEIGNRRTREAPYPISEAEIRHVAEMARDLNPLYFDSEYARNSRHGEMIAPLTALLVWSQDPPNQVGADSDFPDPDLPDQPAWPFAVEKNRVGNFRLPGTSQIIVQTVSLEFSRPLKRGDRVLDTTELMNCSGLKHTRVGPGYFATFLSLFSNQDNEVVGRCTTTLLMYGLPDKEPETMSGLRESAR
jgi:N-terminal half of MaoC dehydratase